MKKIEYPKDWYIVKLKDIATLNQDTLAENTSPEYTFQYIDLSSVKEGSISFQNGYIKFKYSSPRARRILKSNNILMSTVRPNLKGFAIVNFETNDTICSTGFALIQPNDLRDINFIYHNLYSYFLQKQFFQIVVGSNYPALNNSDIENLLFPYPKNSDTRQKIGLILNEFDNYISQTKSLISQKLLLKKALMQLLFTGKKRFKEFRKSTKTRKTKFHPYPVDWEYIPISKVAKQVINLNSNNKDLVVLSCTKYDGLVDSLKYFGRKIYSDDLSTYKIVKRNQFAYATNHIEEGSIGLLLHYDEALISPMYTVFELNENVDANYLYKVFKTETFRHIFEVNTSGSINRRGGLRWIDFSKINIPLPTLKEQKKIASFFSRIDLEIQTLQNKLELIKLQKKGLMQKLLTGKIRVKV